MRFCFIVSSKDKDFINSQVRAERDRFAVDEI